MAKLLVSDADLRPCTVGNMKALFHRWEDKSWIVPPSPMVGGHPGGVVRGTYAIVEMEDGTVREVEPIKVQFETNRELFEHRYIGRWKCSEDRADNHEVSDNNETDTGRR